MLTVFTATLEGAIPGLVLCNPCKADGRTTPSKQIGQSFPLHVLRPPAIESKHFEAICSQLLHHYALLVKVSPTNGHSHLFDDCEPIDAFNITPAPRSVSSPQRSENVKRG